MTVFVIVVLGLRAVGFAWDADRWHRRSDFWERAYMDRAVKLEALVDLSEEYIEESAVLNVRKLEA